MVIRDMNDSNPPKRNWVSYWCLLILQGQNAFNDKAAQFLLVPMGVWLFKEQVDIPMIGAMKYIEYILAAVIVLPFILFSPIAGWFSDRFSKTHVVRGTAVLQLIVLLWIAVAIHHQQIWIAVAGFFMLSVQSVILSPGKRGLVKELIGHEKLGFASGMLEITVVISICGGQIVTGFWYTARLASGLDGWASAMLPLQVITLASVVALVVSFIIQKVPSQGRRPFRPCIIFEHFSQMGELWSTRAIKFSAIGAAFFWGYAGYLNLAAINIAKQITKGGDGFAQESAMLMLAASFGIVLGGAVASFICRKGIELALVPVGGIVMVIGTLALAATPIESYWLRVWFVLAGSGGALLLIPLNANVQDLCPPQKRGKILAGLNLLDCLAGLFAVVIQVLLVAMGVSFKWQFVGLAFVCFLATNYTAKIMPQHFIRLLVSSLIRFFYRIKVLHADRVPKSGGVLLAPNHVSYIDAFILSAVCPRKIRFLIFDECFKNPWIGPFVRLFDTVPISENRSREALRVATEALQEGSVVCIFPEGQLSRTGVINEFRRGFEIIARMADCPVIPVAMDGLWGSIFTFERNHFIYKWPIRIPYGITVGFGSPMPPNISNAADVKSEVTSLSAEAFALRKILARPLKILNRKINVLHGNAKVYAEAHASIRKLTITEQTQIVANAIQIGEVNAIQRNDTVMIEWDALQHCHNVLAIAFVQYFNLKVILVDSDESPNEIKKLGVKYSVDQYFSGENLVTSWRSGHLHGGCYDFSGNPMTNECVYACLVISERIISMSMPHPAARTATNQHQDGYLMGAWGRLLPGYRVECESGKLRLCGVSIGEGFIEPNGKALNADAFIISSSTPDDPAISLSKPAPIAD